MDSLIAFLSLLISSLLYGVYDEIKKNYCPKCGSSKIIIHDELPERSYHCTNCKNEF